MKKHILHQYPLLSSFIITFLIVLAVTLIKVHFSPVIGIQAPFLLYFGVIIVISRTFGRMPAIFAIILMIFAAGYFFMPAFHRRDLESWSQLVQLFIFSAEAYLVLELSTALTIVLAKNVIDQERFKAIIEKSKDAIMLINEDGKITYCSPAVESIIGFSSEDYQLMPLWNLTHADDLENLQTQYLELVQQPGQEVAVIHRMHHKNGQWIWVESRFTNLLSDPNVDSMVVGFSNVHERIELEQAKKGF